MDLNDFWQEHKRFLSMAGVGLAVFGIAYFLIDGRFTGERKSLTSTLSRNFNELGKERYGSGELEQATAENEELRAAVTRLAAAATFETRPRYRFDPSGDSTQYFVLLGEVAQELASAAAQSRILLPPGLDLEALETTQEERIVRHMEALDLVERVLRLAIQEKVKRVQSIRVQLDPGLNSREGVGEVETTRVEFEFRSPAAPIVRLLAKSQSAEMGKPLTLGEAEIVAARAKEDEVSAKISFLIVRLHGEWLAEVVAAPAAEQGRN